MGSRPSDHFGRSWLSNQPDIYQDLYNIVKAPIITFELTNPAFYHLDTCLSILDEKTALACKEAFSVEDWKTLSFFSNLISVSHKESDSPGFACNAHCPDTKHVLIQEGNRKAEKDLESAGFVPIPLQTNEFIKSGGSVFCMKQVMFQV